MYNDDDDNNSNNNDNKSAQSNLGRGSRRGSVVHVHRRVPIGYNDAPQIRPPQKKVPLSVDLSPNRTTYFIPGPVRPVLPNGIRIRFAVFPQCTGQTDARTDRRTDRQIVHGKV